MMKVVESAGCPDVAQVFVLQMRDEPWTRIECVGALDPALGREDKMVFVVSSQLGCPVGCAMCDAGTWFAGTLTAGEIEAQIRHLLASWGGSDAARCRKLKVQFARMGEPSLNPAVLDVIARLPSILPTPHVIPCVATTAPRAAAAWFEDLLVLRRAFGPDSFQVQFSVQSTDEAARDRMMPVAKWTLEEISGYAKRWVRGGDRKVTLNAALAEGVAFDPEVLGRIFDPGTCVVKLTPLNPTARAGGNALRSAMETGNEPRIVELVERLESLGFRCIVSIGDPRETQMGTSCGQMARLGRRSLPMA